MRRYMHAMGTAAARGWAWVRAEITVAEVVMLTGLWCLYVGLAAVAPWVARVVVGAVLVRLAWPRPASPSGTTHRAVR